ncbi:hypothetical protein JXD38_06920 [candidate division WOR-3 bacterium]|nr:hypothetical protein [candidate division WOR-3 bacterium]
MRKLIAAAAILAVVFVIGCQDTQKVSELQGQVDRLNQQITDLQSTVVVKLTAERDSLAKVLADLQAKYPAKGGTTTPPAGGGGTVKPPTKK